MFRNKEIQRFAVCFALITAVTAVAGFTAHPAAGIIALVCAALYGAAFFFFTKARYRSIARISNQIDLVLHNADRIYLGEAQEGELSILQSEITKMTMRIREQNNALKREKERLADSLADVAHQLRTPLTSLNLILSLLENNSDEKQRKALLREMEELLAQMEWLVNALLKLSRLDAGIVTFQKEQVEVSGLIAASLRRLAIPMELHNITVRTAIPAGIRLCVDSGWLSEAVQNLLKNCMEGAGDNGTIKIACEDTLLFTELTFHDSGAGFQSEDLPRLFERFYRGKESGAAGYGIGLALSKTIITRLGGTITAKNHPEGGAVFTLRFPK